MKQELSFKEQKMKNSKDTYELVKKDLDKRKEELDKINSLDTKINLELQSLKEKMTSMTQEMDSFKSEEELRELANEQKKQLLIETQRSKKAREAVKQQVQILANTVDRKKKELALNDVSKRFTELENKLRTYAQTVFTLQEFIQSRKRESDYEGVMRECLQLSTDINQLIISQHK